MRSTGLTVAAFLMPMLLSGQAEIRQERVSVAGTSDEWTPTTIQVAPGDVILVLAGGFVRIGPMLGSVGPNGTSSGDGVLHIKIGVGAGQRAGEKAFIIADQAGQVKLRVADGRYSDNGGAFEVSVIHIPSSLIPMPSESGTAAAGPAARFLAEMKSDLRNLVTAEESYFADSTKYGRSLQAMGYQPSAGVTLVVETVTREGYNATATHVRAAGWTCGIYVGPVRPYTADQKEGSPVCWQSR